MYPVFVGSAKGCSNTRCLRRMGEVQGQSIFTQLLVRLP